MRTARAVAWGLAAFVVAGWLALVEVLWLPLRVGGVLVPASVLAAVVGNLLLPEAAYRMSGSRVVAVVPAVTWLVVAVGGSMRRPEGDLLVTGTGALGIVSMAFLLLGVLAAAFAVGRILAGPRPRQVSPADGGTTTPERAGSGSGGAR